MVLSKKYYKAVAGYIKGSQGDFNELVEDLILMFKNDNPLFNEDKFRKATQEDGI